MSITRVRPSWALAYIKQDWRYERLIAKAYRIASADDPIEPGKVEIPAPGTPVGYRNHTTSARHGTEAGYTMYKCRCEPCTRAASEARRRRRLANPEATREYHRNYKREQAAKKREAA